MAGALMALFYFSDDEPMKEAPLDTRFLRDFAETRGFMLGRPVKPKPTPDGSAVLFLRAQPRVAQLHLFEFDVATGKTRLLLTPEMVLKGLKESLSPEEKARRERMRVSVAGFTDFQLSPDGTTILVSLSGKLYLVERATGKVRALASGAGTLVDPKFAPDEKQIAYVLDYDVYVFNLDSGKETAVTRGGSALVTHGLAEFIAQEEMHRYTGYWWSPDSKSIVYEESDANEVEIWYVADPAHPDRPAHRSHYPRPGKKNVSVRLGIVPVAGGATVWVDWEVKRYPYLGHVHWGKFGPLTITVQSRNQHELALLKVDPLSGKTAPLVVEKDSAWVNLDLTVPRWLSDGQRYLWISERAGGPQLELRNDSRKLGWVLAPPEAGFQGLVDVNPETGIVVYRASTDPTQSHLFRVTLAKDQPVKMTEKAGIHNAEYSSDHSLYVQTASLIDAVPETTVHKADGTMVGTLPSVAEDPPFQPRSRVYKIGADPGYYAWIVRPLDFDARRKYPVIVDVYGGPHHNHVLAPMMSRLRAQWIANQGFIVVAIDGRGTPGRGRDWERAISKRFGSVPLEDQVRGLRLLAKEYPEMDLNRVGIVGWSFGGYMAALAVMREPELFKAAVAGAPVVDWLDYDTHYTERYLGMPKTDAAAYDEASLLTYAGDLKRPLLLLHGTADDNVYFRHSLKLADALFRAGKDFEILPLPSLTHMVPDPLVNERLWSRIVRFFQKNLGKATARDE